MNGEQLKRLVNRLGLKLGQYVIIGSGNLAIRGIRPTEDLDLWVSDDMYAKLREQYGGEDERYGQTYLEFFIDGVQVDAHAEWKMPGYQPDFAAYLNNPEIIEGLPFMPLEHIYDWKNATRRDKDVRDLKLIDAYWQRQQKSVE